MAHGADAGDAGLTVNARKLLPVELDPERDPSVIVRDASGSTLRPPPVSRRRLRVQTLPGLGERADEHRACLRPVSDDDFSAVDELLASFELAAD